MVMYTANASTRQRLLQEMALAHWHCPTREENDDEQGDGPEDGQIIGTPSFRTTRLTGPRVAWDEDVIDNEGIGKKSKSNSSYSHLSKLFLSNSHSIAFHLLPVCCVYHKPRRFDESSSDESSSDSDSDSCSHHHHDHSGHNHNHLNPSRRGSSSSNPQQAQRGRGIVREPEI